MRRRRNRSTLLAMLAVSAMVMGGCAVKTVNQRPYLTTALGASEVNLLELASAYRAIASGVVAMPHVIRSIVLDGSDPLASRRVEPPKPIGNAALFLIQEGLRGVVRMPTGTAHALAARGFPIAVMGKTGTTNDFRDALFWARPTVSRGSPSPCG